MTNGKGCRPLRVVVAGTGFGRVYLDAVASAPGRYSLAGVLSRGSDQSARVAAERGVPLFTCADEVPGDVDVVCVVVGSGVVGGRGAELAQEFLDRGVHVLHEHPVHSEELAACLRAARRGGAAYRVNTLYPEIAPVRRFLAAAQALLEHQEARFVDAACNSQVLYPLLDVLGRAVGGLRPWSLAEPCPVPEPPAGTGAQPFRFLYATVGGVPATLRVQNQVHPGDPDNHSHLLHRVSLGTDAGVLTLGDTHGPVLWNARMHADRDGDGRLVMSGPGTDRLDVSSTTVLDGGDWTAPTYSQVFSELWPGAVLRSLDSLAGGIGDPSRTARDGQWALAVSTAWSRVSGTLGMPEPVRPEEPGTVPVETLLQAAARA